MIKNNKWFVWIILIVLSTLLLSRFILLWFFSVKIPVWNIGIKVNMYWDWKWVSIYTLKTWRNWYNPITSDVYKYPVFIQQKEYTSVSFQDIDWLVITSNIGMDYQFKQESVPKIFETYRQSADDITNQLMATWLKSAVNRASSKFKVDELYWPKKEDFRVEVLNNIKKDFDKKWILISNIYFVWDMSLPPEVMKRISAKIEATQTAMQKENELRTVEAEAKKKVAEAKWTAESILIQAKAEAEAIRIKAQAIVTQWWEEYVQLQAIERWNWILPVTTLGNNVPFVNLK